MGVEVVDAPARRRYELTAEGRLAGILDYRLNEARITLIHTEVDGAYEGRGYGSAIARHALDDARARGLRVRVLCPFVAEFLDRHHDWDDLIDSVVRR